MQHLLHPFSLLVFPFHSSSFEKIHPKIRKSEHQYIHPKGGNGDDATFEAALNDGRPTAGATLPIVPLFHSRNESHVALFKTDCAVDAGGRVASSSRASLPLSSLSRAGGRVHGCVDPSIRPFQTPTNPRRISGSLATTPRRRLSFLSDYSNRPNRANITHGDDRPFANTKRI